MKLRFRRSHAAIAAFDIKKELAGFSKTSRTVMRSININCLLLPVAHKYDAFEKRHINTLTAINK